MLFQSLVVGVSFFFSSQVSFGKSPLPSTKANTPRWVSLSPQITQWVFDIGMGKNLVGVSEYSHYPPQAQKLDRVGTAYHPNIEKILLLKPTLVLIDGTLKDSTLQTKLEMLHIASKEIVFNTPDDLLKLTLASIDEKSPLSLRLKKFLDCQKSTPPPASFTFIALAWDNPLVLAGASSFFSQLVESLGGSNLAPFPHKPRYPTLSTEWLVGLSPDVIYVSGEKTAHFIQSHLHWFHPPPQVIPLPDALFSRAHLGIFSNLSMLVPLQAFVPQEAICAY